MIFRRLRPATLALVVCLLATACEDESCKEFWWSFLIGPDWGPTYWVRPIYADDLLPVREDVLFAGNDTLGLYAIAADPAPIIYERGVAPLVKIPPKRIVGYYSLGSALYDALFERIDDQPEAVRGIAFLNRIFYFRGLYGVSSVNPRDGSYHVIRDGLPSSGSGFIGASWPSPDGLYVWWNSNGQDTGSYFLAKDSSRFVKKFGLPQGTNYWVDAADFEAPSHVLVAHRGAGLSQSSDGGMSFQPFSMGLDPGFAGKSVRLAWSAAYTAGNTGYSFSDPIGAAFRHANSGVPAGAGSAVSSVGDTVYYAMTGTDGWAHVYRSVNRGHDFLEVSTGLKTREVRDLYVTAAGDVWAATLSGVWVLRNGATEWTDACAGMGGSQVPAVYPIVGSTFAEKEPLAGAATPFLAATSGPSANGIFKSTDGGRTYAASGSVLDGKSVYAFARSGSTFVAAGSDGVYRSTDAATWSLVPAGTAGVPTTRLTALLATSGNLLLATLGGPGIVRSTDAGASWAPATGLPAGATVYALAGSGSTLLAGASGAVYRSIDSGASWVKVTSPSAGTFSVISLAPTTSGDFYAGVFESAGAKHTIVLSTDGGASWSPRGAGLPKSPPYALLAADGALFTGNTKGLYRSTDGGVSWTAYERHLFNTQVGSLSADTSTLYVGTVNRGMWPLPLRPHADRLLSIVLDVPTASAHFTTELALVNRGTTAAAVTLRYTASLGSGSGVVNETLAAGRQLVVPDAIGYLRGKGLAIPTSGAQGGTLLVSFDGISDLDVVGVTARTATATTAPQPVGRAGLAYSAIDPRNGTPTSLTVYALRSTSDDRSNLAVFNTGEEPVTLKVTAYSGAAEGGPKVIEAARTLPPYGWYQYNGILVTAGFTNGYVTVERVSDTGAFSAYGVVNNQVTSDGSYILPNDLVNLLSYVNVPVLVEAGAFVSELVLANSGSTSADLELDYRESLSPAAGAGGTVHVTLAAGEQKIIPGAVDFLRTHGAAIGAKGGSYAGSLHVVAGDALIANIHASARTSSQSGAGGQFGLFTPGVYAGGEAAPEAYLYGLRADDTNRTNVAVLNTGESAAGAITLSLQAYDGDAGGAAAGTAETVTLQPGEWHQFNNFLASKGVKNGWVRVFRTAGTAYWITYAVVNDGGAPGQRTGDGAYVPAVR